LNIELDLGLFGSGSENFLNNSVWNFLSIIDKKIKYYDMKWYIFIFNFKKLNINILYKYFIFWKYNYNKITNNNIFIFNLEYIIIRDFIIIIDKFKYLFFLEKKIFFNYSKLLVFLNVDYIYINIFFEIVLFYYSYFVLCLVDNSYHEMLCLFDGFFPININYIEKIQYQNHNILNSIYYDFDIEFNVLSDYFFLNKDLKERFMIYYVIFRY